MVPDVVTGGQGKHYGSLGIMVFVFCGRGGVTGGPGTAARDRREVCGVAVVTSSEDTGTSGFSGAVVPGIPVSAGALIFDRAGRLLILKPTYKSGWTIPGGVMEADGETPWEACRREVREETGIEVARGRLAAMDFRRPRPGRPGGVRFLFDCGKVSDKALAGLVLQPEEISESRLAPPPHPLAPPREPSRRRVRAAPRGRRLVYLEDGRPVPGVGEPARS